MSQKQLHFIAATRLGLLVSGFVTINIILPPICTEPTRTAQWLGYTPSGLYAVCPAFNGLEAVPKILLVLATVILFSFLTRVLLAQVAARKL